MEGKERIVDIWNKLLEKRQKSGFDVRLKVTLYRFDDNELILTASGEDYAANALNAFFGGTNTTFEGQ